MEDEASLLSESKFRQYVAAVDKALKNFEYSSEWADLISCLGKLNKTIQSYPQYHVIPKKIFVGKRLSQCLHPALPSGVHLKALETYNLIFNQIGPKLLAQDLFIFSAGIFPLLSQAAISVKPVLFDLYENHFLPLGKKLLPGLPGLVLAVLPGIEEASEHTARTTVLLEKFCANSDEESFFAAIWNCVLYSPSVRLSALTFVIGHIGNLQAGHKEEKLYILGNDKNLLTKSICAALEDNNVLVQRMTLEFLIVFLPIHTKLLQSDQLMHILMLGLSVVLRRDMSLNRRLFQWLLGLNGTNNAQELQRAGSVNSIEGHTEDEIIDTLDYFQEYSKNLVIAALVSLFQNSKIDKYAPPASDKGNTNQNRKKHDELRPFRILISLLDKPEIGSVILEDVLLEVFRTLHQNCIIVAGDGGGIKETKKWKPQKGTHDELVKTANLLFNAFEPYFIWEFLSKTVTKCRLFKNTMESNDDDKNAAEKWRDLVHSELPTYSELFQLIDFLLDVVSLEASLETQSEHWPDLLNKIIIELAENVEQFKISDIKQGTQLASKLLSKISPPVRSFGGTDSRALDFSRNTFVGERSRNQFTGSEHDSIPTSPIPQSHSLVGETMQFQTTERIQSPVNVMQECMPAMHLCIRSSKLLFTKFVAGRIIPQLAEESNSICSVGCNNCERKYFNQICSVLSHGRSHIVVRETTCCDTLTSKQSSPVPDGKQEDELYCRTFVSLCKFLVELSCFPLIRESPHYGMSGLEFVHLMEEPDFEQWVESLIACCNQEDNFDIQSTAICTLLDLINVSISVPQNMYSVSDLSASPRAVPLISPKYIDILESSHLFEKLAWSLWVRILPTNVYLHRTCVELFLQLHNLTPSPYTCEDVISKTLVNPDLNLREKAFWKFGVLWHLSRDFYKNADNSRSSRGPVRTFDRCLLLMLDGLHSDSPKIRIHVTEWLRHAIHFGDIGRILEPLLLILLDPSSSRVGVHYVNQVIKRDALHARDRPKVGNHTADMELIDISKDTPLSDSDSERDDDLGMKKALDATMDSIVSDSFETAPVDSMQQGLQEGDGRDAESGFADDEDEEEDESHKKLIKKIDKKNKDLEFDKGSAKENQGQSEQLGDAYRAQVHPLMVHKLYYLQHVDTLQILHALDILLAVLRTDGRAFVCSALTASMSMCSTPHQASLRELLIRHRKAITGRQFFGSLSDSHQLLVRASTAKYLEILLTVCLYFVRSDYHSCVPTTEGDIEGNLRVQVQSVDLLTMIVNTMMRIASDSSSGFADFVSDILTRCKVQRIVLHCLLSTVYTLSEDVDSDDSWSPRGVSSSTESTKSDSKNEPKNVKQKSPSHSIQSQSEECIQKLNLQKAVLRLTEELIYLEDTVRVSENKTVDQSTKGKARKQPQVVSISTFDYLPSHCLAIQPMFLSVVLSTLKEQDWLFLHHEWISMITNSLPRLNEALPKLVVPVVDQLCLNLRSVAEKYGTHSARRSKQRSTYVPPDHLLTLLEDVTAICHFCLIDVSALHPMISTAPKGSSTVQTRRRGVDEEELVMATNSLQIISNLMHVFSAQGAPTKTTSSEEVNQPLSEAREGLLSILPTIVSSMVTIWQTWKLDIEANTRQNLTLASEKQLLIGHTKIVRQAVLQFLTPIAMNHTIVFLASTADVWNQSKVKDASQPKPVLIKKGKEWLTVMNRKILPLLSDEQQAMIEIISSIKVLTLENVVETIKLVLRQMLTNKEKQRVTHALEVNLLQFLYEVLQKRTAEEMLQVKSNLMTLIKDGLQLNLPPPALFVLLSIFSKFILRVPVPEDRRARRELQDIAQKLLEGCNAIAAASLESSAWFRRSLMVIPQTDQSVDMDESSQSERVSVSESGQGATVNTKNAQFSVQALCILAEILAPMLDVLYVSEEKDKVANIMVNVMYNVIPYLKNHSASNISGFRACSAFLTAMSDYQYTLRAWKKEVYDLFLDADFFSLDPLCIPFWRAVIDRLMTYDATLFKDVMTKITMAQSGTMNIFANREQEMEQRAQLLKRLSFTIFCGEMDQYHSALPEIQERLAESLRQVLVPVLHEQVFLCFRVLLLRMSPHHLVSLWLHIITEMVVVFLQMEQDLLKNGSEGTKSSRLSSVESFFGLNGVAQNTERWLALYLAACKMLDFALSLPSEIIPQFQVYKWAFVDTPGIALPDLSQLDIDLLYGEADKKKKKRTTKKRNGKDDTQKPAMSKMAALNAPLASKSSKSKSEDGRDDALKQKKAGDVKASDVDNNTQLYFSFFPYLSRLTALLLRRHKEESLARLTRKPGQPVITMSRIQSMEELLPFFLSVTGQGASCHVEDHAVKLPKLDHFESLVERDFVVGNAN